MLDNIIRVSNEQLLSVQRIDDYLESDRYIRSLVPIDKPLIAFNPTISNADRDLIYWVKNLVIEDKCIILNYNNDCIAKIFPPYWNSDYESYQIVDIEKPKYIWKKNPILDKSIKFKNDPMENYVISPWDKDYELVWYLDPKYNSTSDNILIYSCRPLGKSIKRIKEIGYIVPDLMYEWKKNSDLDELMIFNDDPRHSYFPSIWDKDYELVWYLDPRVNRLGNKIWALKCNTLGVKSKGIKDMGYIMPDISVEFNPNIPEFNVDIDKLYPNYWELNYNNIYNLHSFHQDNEDLWALKFSPNYGEYDGWRILGDISPDLEIEYNPLLKNLNYDLDHSFKWYEFKYEHVWLLDRSYLNEGEDDIWVFKVKLSNNIIGTKIVGYISPTFNVVYNKTIPNLNYEIDYNFKWYDLVYSHVWYLDRKHLNEGEDDIWAFKLKFGTKHKGTKHKGYISPNFNVEYNRNLPNFNFDIDYNIPWYDLQYQHIWYLDENYYDKKEKIWNIKISATSQIKGEKEIGKIIPLISNQLDVIFISYNESNAEKNWQRVLEKAPWAKRVSGVSGIFNAHREAAKLSSTDMFYVVDGDAYLVDEWNFDFQPNIFDRDCAYVWASKNPINNLVYQNGGVKLFSKHILMKKKTWKTLDMFTGIMPDIKSDDTVSCITLFNVDPFSTWRSAFRECVKLYISNQITKLNVWATQGSNKKFGKYAIEGAKDAIDFAKKNENNYNLLLKINDYEWLISQFKEKYSNV